MHTGLAEGDEEINHWPALLDLVTSSLMLFLLLTFLQTSFSAASLEAIEARARQDRFLRSFDSEFASEIAAGTVAVARNVDFLQITFSDRVLFDSGEFRLLPRGRQVLSRCAAVFAGSGTTFQQIQVEGHTDRRRLARSEYPSNNWELSTARALSVVQFLAAGHGLAPELFSANGYGPYRPVTSNRTASGRARNRRIEIRLFFAGAHHAGESRKGRAAGQVAR